MRNNRDNDSDRVEASVISVSRRELLALRGEAGRVQRRLVAVAEIGSVTDACEGAFTDRERLLGVAGVDQRARQDLCTPDVAPVFGGILQVFS